VRLPAGAAPDFLAAFREQAVPALEAFDLDLVGAFRVAMVNDSEAIVIWAVPDWATWARVEQAWLGEGDDADLLAGWRKTTLGLGADWRRSLLVDAPLAPLRLGRQPAASDRRPLDEI
jgi:hypothetical protein